MDDSLDISTWGINHAEPPPKAALTTLKTTINKHSASGKVGRKRKSSGSGKGGFWSHRQARSAFVQEPREFDRRAVIKARVCQHEKPNRTAKGRGKKILQLHMRYIQRDGVSQENRKGELYNARETNLSDKEFIELCADDKHHFRFIVSPEDGAQLDLTQYTRALVAKMEEDLGTRLEWVAVNHYNTDNPHSHVVIRGVDDHGKDLVIAPDYISHGIRGRACEIATQELGPLSQVDLNQKVQATLKQDQWTQTDKQLQAMAQDDALGRIKLFELPSNAYGYELHQRYITRLHHLRDLGLAREMTHGIWSVDPELQPKLKAVKERNDLTTLVRQHIGEARAAHRFDKDHEQQQTVIGQVVGKGLENELYDRGYLVVDGIDGQVHYVAMWDAERFAEIRQDDIVSVEVVKAAPFHTKADDNLARYAGEKGKVYEPDAHKKHVEDNRLCKPENVDTYINKHQSRLKTLVTRQIVDKDEQGRVVIPGDLPTRLEQYKEKMQGKLKNRMRCDTLDHGDLTKLACTRGPTYLDDILSAREAPAIANTHFGQTLREGLRQRQAWLVEQGLAESDKAGDIRLKPGLKARLTDMEIAEVAKAHKENGERLVRLKPTQHFEGTAKQVVNLRSGRYLQVVNDENPKRKEFFYMPHQKDVSRFLGQEVMITSHSGRSQTFKIDKAPKRQHKLL